MGSPRPIVHEVRTGKGRQIICSDAFQHKERSEAFCPERGEKNLESPEKFFLRVFQRISPLYTDICSLSCTSMKWAWLSCQISTGCLCSCSPNLRNSAWAEWNITFNIIFCGVQAAATCKWVLSQDLNGFGTWQPFSFRVVSWEFFPKGNRRSALCCFCFDLVRRRKITLH